jgi:hypothetical protein
MTTTTRIVEIIECEKQADQHVKISDEYRWKAAELIADELAAGMSQRQLAAEIGKGRAHVCYMNRVWLLFGRSVTEQRPPFAQAYAEAQKSEAQRSESARLTAVSYRTVIFDPVTMMAALFDGKTTTAEIAAHMADFPDYVTASRDQIITVIGALTQLAEALS